MARPSTQAEHPGNALIIVLHGKWTKMACDDIIDLLCLYLARWLAHELVLFTAPIGINSSAFGSF